MPPVSNAVKIRDNPPPPEPKQAKTPKISKRIREVVNLLVTGECKTIKAAAERTGMHPNYLSGALKKPEIQAFIASESRKTIAAGTMRASARLLELLDASSEHVSLDASKHVLAIEGIRPPESGTNINIINNVAPGYVIDLREPSASPLIQHEREIEAKPLTSRDDVREGE